MKQTRRGLFKALAGALAAPKLAKAVPAVVPKASPKKAIVLTDFADISDALARQAAIHIDMSIYNALKADGWKNPLEPLNEKHWRMPFERRN